MNNEFLPAYKVYQQVIDLELYYAFVDLVVHTYQEEKAWEIYRNIVDTQIWQQKAEGQNYFEAYNLRYPGEVLERFEEKLGKDVRIIRALALALGKTRALQLDNMFVGNQRGSFLQMIRRTSNGDVYLQGALYLLETDMPRRHALLDELAATEYAGKRPRRPRSAMSSSRWRRTPSNPASTCSPRWRSSTRATPRR